MKLGPVILLELAADGPHHVVGVERQRHLLAMRSLGALLQRLAADEVVIKLDDRPVAEVPRSCGPVVGARGRTRRGKRWDLRLVPGAAGCAAWSPTSRVVAIWRSSPPHRPLGLLRIDRALDQPLVGNSLWTCRPISSDQVGGGEQADDRTAPCGFQARLLPLKADYERRRHPKHRTATGKLHRTGKRLLTLPVGWQKIRRDTYPDAHRR